MNTLKTTEFRGILIGGLRENILNSKFKKTKIPEKKMETEFPTLSG